MFYNFELVPIGILWKAETTRESEYPLTSRMLLLATSGLGRRDQTIMRNHSTLRKKRY
jgi:hypothetical protein